MDTLKFGDLVGVDKYGNKYYQNNYYFYGKNRWVEYNDKVFFDYDASQVPAEWHNWLHYMTDDPPTTNPRVQYKWMIDHTENFSGTNRQYVPYSTVKQKITQWQPKDGQKIKYNVK
ncbi:putative NADH dehydrogenase [ubiquinone] 1 alpha subcomplex subunit 12-like protein [Dinothrombium tinctorium]|uniref:NADH dehydrogenase [ubiquinone] 1 alpha subcomplex subunit 12 n=1 Tax=Dinothrombium tinctorium TaxID=1965070 RepID=A0A3S3NWK9_9ACAR|nr:putative NADH dehydrogenase [ubiquinone] 1 alpha subcomplex subunit 12-like protein [Dinothrombium tinctorium]